MQNKKLQLLKLNLIILFLIAIPTLAAEFNPNIIISDAELVDSKSMDLESIKSFLSKRNGTLKSYMTVDKDGAIKSASETFFEVSNRWLINPKYLLVLVQKEQSLLESSNPTQRQYDAATGYGCPDSGGCDERWKGFYRQVNSAAAQTRYYMDHIDEFNFRPGKSYTISGQNVIPENKATAALYNYTPHIHGNKNFWSLYNKYFSQKWPDGSLLKSDDSETVYLIENSTKRPITSKAILLSRFDPKRVIEVLKVDLDNYAEGVPIKYLNFALLQGSGSDIFMLTGDSKRKFVTKDIFTKAGFQEDEIVKVNDSELSQYKDGSDITEYTLYPAGKLMQEKSTQKIYYVLGGTKRLVATNEILKYNFSGMPIVKVDSGELNMFPTGNPIPLPDGMIIKANDAAMIYVISNGQRMPILNATAFKMLKYSWKNVVVISPKSLEVHPVGQIITGEW